MTFMHSLKGAPPTLNGGKIKKNKSLIQKSNIKSVLINQSHILSRNSNFRDSTSGRTLTDKNLEK